MKVLIFGGNGMLGHKLVQIFSERYETWTTLRGTFDDVERFGFFRRNRTVENVDVRSTGTLKDVLSNLRPNVVINCVGVIKQKPTDVIDTLEINSIFPQRLGVLAAEMGFKLITISTDCVFDGMHGNYDDDAVPNALDLYGQSKRWGEVSRGDSLTLRTSIIGRELSSGHSLVEWFLSQAGGKIDGYSQAIYSGFPTVVFADIIIDIVENHHSLTGVYNVSSEPIDKFSLLSKLNNLLDLRIEINKSEDLVLDRSLNSERYRAVTGFIPETWDQMLVRLAADCKTYNKWNKQGN